LDEAVFLFPKRRTFLGQALITANDFRARLRFPRMTREPPRLRLRGLTLATSPAGVYVLHSNQPLEQAEN
jgi:hypothetical protein